MSRPAPSPDRSRRRFLKTALAAAAASAVPTTLDALFARAALASGVARGFGPLVPDPAGLLDLPAGFDYVTFSTARLGTTSDPRFSQRLGNGEFVPARHDGMACFAGLGGISVLVRCHELHPRHSPMVDARRLRPYDPKATAGTTTLWVDDDRRLVRSFPSLSGTYYLCSGGVTPWGTFLACEECTFMPGPLDRENHDQTPDAAMPHGYVFEVDSRAEGLVDPVPIRSMGRFMHEATAVDPVTGYVYMTEDRPDGLFYRYRPDVVVNGVRGPRALRAGDLARGGVLEAMRIVERHAARTDNRQGAPRFPRGRNYAVDWIAIPDADPRMDMRRDPTDPDSERFSGRAVTAESSTRAQGAHLGAALFTRGEGLVYRKGALYFACTDGGASRLGQIWRFDPLRQLLTLWAEPEDRSLMDAPDNIDFAPWGDLIVAEDGRGPDQIIGVIGGDRFYPIARNALNQGELAGPCFSPDGRTLYLNMHDPGITFAIRGPWGKRGG
jgi:secreted PhoX family phosphatase